MKKRRGNGSGKNKIRNTIPNDIEMNRIDFSVAHYISSHKNINDILPVSFITWI
jgi:hypothetical protein